MLLFPPHGSCRRHLCSLLEGEAPGFGLRARSSSSKQEVLESAKRKPVITLPKVFVLGSFGHLLESHHHTNKDHSGREGPIAGLEGKTPIHIPPLFRLIYV